MKINRGKIESAQKVVLYGPEGIGKSTFAAQFPNPLFIDTEGSTKRMDVARTPAPSSWSMLLNQVGYVKKNPDICKTLVIDTADWAEQLCVDHICARDGKDGLEGWGYGKGFTYLAEEFGRLLNHLNDVIDRGVNVALTAHAQIKKFEQPDEMGSYDRWELKLQKKTAPLVKEWADMVLFANYKTFVVKSDETNKGKAQGGKRVMFTTHHPAWDAKNRHDLKNELPLDYKEIAHCIPTFSNEKPLESNKSEPESNNNAVKQPEQPATKEPKAEAPEEQKAEQKSQAPPEPTPTPVEPVAEEPSLPDGVPKALGDLMLANGVTLNEIQDVVAYRGYYPKGTPITNYDSDFINGVLVGAWDQVYGLIEAKRMEDAVPF